jgi:hypothetical protein
VQFDRNHGVAFSNRHGSATVPDVSVAIFLGFITAVRPESRSRLLESFRLGYPDLRSRTEDPLSLGLSLLGSNESRDFPTAVSTPHCVKYAALVAAWMSVGRGAFLVGPIDSGKASILRRASDQLDQSVSVLACDSTTTSASLFARIRLLCKS